MSLKKGHTAVLTRIFNSASTLVYEGVTRFSYVYSEKADDASFITIETNNIALVDDQNLQEGKKLIVVWGYIGGFLQKRIVYVFDLKTEFTASGIRIEVQCYCKAAFMKLNSSKFIMDAETVDELGEQMAEAYGLDYKTQNLKPDEENDADENAFYEVNTGGVTEAKEDFTKTNPQITVARDKTSAVLNYAFKKYPEGIPQANRTDKKTLEDTAANEPTDNIFFDTRDDDLILKKRNFLQQPYKAYTYKAEPGYLLSFVPATKNADNKKFGVANTVSGWLEEDKEYVQGEVTRSKSGAGVLGDIIELSLEEQVKKNIENGEGNPLDRGLTVDGLGKFETVGVDEEGKPIKKLVIQEKMDSTTTIAMWHKQGTVPSKLVVSDKKLFNSAALDVTGRIETKGIVVFNAKEYLPTVETTPKDIAGSGLNRQSDKEMDLNENQAEVVGDPTLITGKVITILGVGKRYSGNYYISQAIHEITPEGGYICYLKLYRTGHGKIGNEEPNKIDAAQRGLIKNAKVANPTDGTTQLISIPIRNDSDFIDP